MCNLFQTGEKSEKRSPELKNKNESSKPKNIRETPAQEKLKADINMKNAQVSHLKELENTGFSSVSRKEVSDLIQKRKALEGQLKRLQQNSDHQKKSRERKKLKIEQACETSPEVRNILKSINKEKPGRPRLGKSFFWNYNVF